MSELTESIIKAFDSGQQLTLRGMLKDEFKAIMVELKTYRKKASS